MIDVVQTKDAFLTEYDGVVLMHLTCVLCKLGILASPVMVRSSVSHVHYSNQDVVKFARSYLEEGRLYIFENPSIVNSRRKYSDRWER